MNKEKLEMLEEISKPVQKFLKENYHPHAEVVVTFDGILVKEVVARIPNKNDQPED